MICTKVREVGNSLGITIAKELRDTVGLCRGDTVALVLGVGGHIIIIQIPEKGNIDLGAAAEELPTIDYDNRDDTKN